MFWEHLREEEFEDAIKRSKGTCVVPIGCLEKHGQHLPQGTDYYAARTMIERVAEVEDVVIFPTGFWLGNVSTYHSVTNFVKKNVRGSIGISLDTLTRSLEELCDEIARNGFAKIILLNAHGGNIGLLKQFLRLVERKKKPYAVFFVRMTNGSEYPDVDVMYEEFLKRRDEFPMLTDEDMETLKEWSKMGFGGGHADPRETCYVMCDHPELAVADRYDAESGKNIHRTEFFDNLGVGIFGGWGRNYPNAFNGNFSFGCTQSIGEAVTLLESDRIVRLLRAIKEDVTFVEAAQRLSR